MAFFHDVTHWFLVQIKAEYESGEYPETKQEITDALVGDDSSTVLLRRVCENIFYWMGGATIDEGIQGAMLGSVDLKDLKRSLQAQLTKN